MNRLRTLTVIALASQALASPGLAQQFSTPTLIPQDVEPLGRFGEVVVVQGTLAAVGHPGRSGVEPAEGAVELYALGASGWVPSGLLTAPAPEFGDEFGRSLALQGDLLAVGAPGLWNGTNPGGAVYVYRLVGSTWTLEAQLFGATDQHLGTSVDLDGPVLIAEAAGYLPAGVPSVVNVYRDSGAGWGLEDVLAAANGANQNAPGRAVAVLGNTVVVGKRSSGGSSIETFEFAGGVWSPGSPLLDPAAGTGDLTSFGAAVELGALASGDVAFVGAPMADGTSVDEGAVHVFERQAGSWALVETLRDSTPAIDGGFGSGLALFGELLVASTPRFGPMAGDGYVDTFLRRSGAFEPARRFDQITSTGGLPAGLATDGQRLLVGAPDVDLGPSVGQTTGLAHDPSTGWAYGCAGGQLYVMRPNYKGALIGDMGIAKPRGLAFDAASGMLYAVDIETDQLFSVDPSTAVSTPIGLLGFDEVRALAYHSGLGVLMGVDGVNDRLIRIDPSTGAGTVVGALPYNDVRGLGYDAVADVLYGFDRPSFELFSVNPVNANTTDLGNYFTTVWALGHDPMAGRVELVTTSGSRVHFDAPSGKFQAFAQVTAEGAGVVNTFELDLAETYCTAGTSAAGCSAALSSTGLASASFASGFTLSAVGVEGGRKGLFFFGTAGRQANPWGNGSSFQCVVPPVARAGILPGSGTPGQCDGLLTQDLNAFWCPGCPGAAKNPGSGALVQAQLWYRDPVSTSNQTSSFSDAIEFLVGY